MVVSGFLNIYPRWGVFVLEPVPQKLAVGIIKFNRNLRFTHEARTRAGHSAEQFFS
jgi:hypothetical protein